jgi:hypothetical protein
MLSSESIGDAVKGPSSDGGSTTLALNEPACDFRNLLETERRYVQDLELMHVCFQPLRECCCYHSIIPGNRNMPTILR